MIQQLYALGILFDGKKREIWGMGQFEQNVKGIFRFG